MNYLEEQADEEAMINSIKNGDQPLPRVTQMSIAGTLSTEQPPLKDKSMWSDQEKRIQKIYRLARSLLIQGLPNDIYSLIDSNKTAKDLWHTLARHMLGSEYGEQDRKVVILYEYETFKATERELLLDTYIQYLQVINDLKKCGYLKDNYVNDAMGSKKKTVVVTSDPLDLTAEKTKVSKSKEKVVVSSDSEGSEADDFSELKKITAWLAKDFNRKKFDSKPTNNNLKTSSTSQSANKKQEFVKTDNKKLKKKDDEKKRDMSRVKCYNYKKEGHFAKDCKKVKVKDYEYYKTKMLLAKKDKDEQVLLAKDQAWMESSSDLDQEINANMVFMDQIEKVLSNSEASSSSVDEIFLRDIKNTVLEKDFKISELEECVSNKDLEIEKCLERLNVCENKLHKMGQTNQTVHMIMPSKDTLYNGQKGIGFENPSYLEKAKDLRPTLYDEKVIGLGYTMIFLTHSDEALEIEKFKRSRENKIEFAYDYGNLNASYVNEKINFEDDYFQDIINPDFEKIDSPFQQTSSLKPYVPNVILEKIIIDLEDEVVNLLEKEKVNLKTIESLKSKGVESSETIISESKNQSENDCFVVENECDKEENSKTLLVVLEDLRIAVLFEKKKGSSNTSNVDLSAVSISKLNKNVKRYSRKDLLACNNSHLGETSSAYMCNDAMNVFCDSRMNDLLDDNNFFIFDDEIVKISPVSKMRFRKKPCDYMIVRSKKHMTGNRALLTNFVEKFLGTKTQVNLQLQVQRVRIDNYTEFKNKTLAKFFDENVRKLKEKGDIRVFVGYSKESAAFRIYNKRTLLIVSEASKKDLEYLFQEVYDEYFDSSKIMKSFTTNVETPINEEVFYDVFESFQGESSSSSLNDDVQQSPEEVILPQTNTQSISINMVLNGDEASTSHNVFNERLVDAYFDA
nr:hypothetical protein [Tanacetum cinerariifolium]